MSGWDITVEIKAVNHRYFEFSCRAPRNCGYMEDKLKSLVQSGIARGKTDLYLQIASTGENNDETVKVNLELAKSYMESLAKLSEATGLPMEISLSSLSRYPDVLTPERVAVDEDALWEAVSAVAKEALANFIAMRETEGRKLKEDLLSRLDTVLALTAEVEKQSPQTVENYRNRLYQKLSTLLADRNIDDARVLTEAAIFADRIAVDEETVRLKSHVDQFRGILESDEPIGRKLDFLTQELNRESNTIGSKAQDSKILSVVVDLKSELEKIREQIQNIE
ncbi:MAG: YicC family protein [Oscillospiraceae bacterium]|nr:YicC family protein [Oscillospiraceae bacterium]